MTNLDEDIDGYFARAEEWQQAVAAAEAADADRKAKAERVRTMAASCGRALARVHAAEGTADFITELHILCRRVGLWRREDERAAEMIPAPPGDGDIRGIKRTEFEAWWASAATPCAAYASTLAEETP